MLPVPAPSPNEPIPAVDPKDLFGGINWSKYKEEYRKYLEEWKAKSENGEFQIPDQEITLSESNFEYDEKTGNFNYSVCYKNIGFALTGNVTFDENDFSFSVFTVTVNDETKEVNFTVTKATIDEKIAAFEEQLKDWLGHTGEVTAE